MFTPLVCEKMSKITLRIISALHQCQPCWGWCYDKTHQIVWSGVQHLPHFFRHRAIIKSVKMSIKESSELIDLQPPAVSLPSLHVGPTCKTVSSYANYRNIFQLVQISPTSFFHFCQQGANGWTLRSGGVIIDKNYIRNNIQCISFLRS